MKMRRREGSSNGIVARIGAAMALAALSGAASGQMIYSEDFEGGAASFPEWSHQTVSQTPVGQRGFLGEFSNDMVVLALNALPAHTSVKVQFDLYLIRSWDGNTFPGPDRWGMNVIDGQNKTAVVDTTFTVSSPLGNWRDQAWPDPYGQGSYFQRTGAAENNTLGYDWKGWDDDAVYNMSFIVPHTGSSLSVEFWASGLQPIWDESWGLDNVQITAIPAPGAMALLGVGGLVGLRRRR